MTVAGQKEDKAWPDEALLVAEDGTQCTVFLARHGWYGLGMLIRETRWLRVYTYISLCKWVRLDDGAGAGVFGVSMSD